MILKDLSSLDIRQEFSLQSLEYQKKNSINVVWRNPLSASTYSTKIRISKNIDRLFVDEGKVYKKCLPYRTTWYLTNQDGRYEFP